VYLTPKQFKKLKYMQFRALLECPSMEGLIIQSYGVGNIPSNQIELIQVIKEAVNNGTVIVNITQCAQGTVSPSYETGKVICYIKCVKIKI
jgi:lysophospholipase